MSLFLIFISTMLVLDAVWLGVSVWLARGTRWKWVTIAFVVAQMIALGLFIYGRMTRAGWDRALPKFALSSIYIWHFLGLALVVATAILAALGWLGRKAVRGRKREEAGVDAPGYNRNAGMTRREFIGAAAAVVPPVATFSLAGLALSQLDHFRVRRFELPFPALPAELDGLTIAQVSDMHVGRFTSGRVLRKIVDATNELRADLVLLTGDLINDALADLPSALDCVRAMEGRHGVWLIEGNHDLIENAAEFERRMKASGVPFLLDESVTVPIRGVNLQLLGLSWTRAGGKERDARIGEAVNALLEQRDPAAFSILLAHHPHAFDAAAVAEIPLTLAGHTHGGQLMLNEALGFGPAMFRYWSGVYRKGASQLVVSNGVGNWFPVRTNAPAEIVVITLRRSEA